MNPVFVSQDTTPEFEQQVRNAMIRLLEEQIPCEISARTLNDARLWEILCHAATKRGYLEGTCAELRDAPSGNTVREHLHQAFADNPAARAQLEEQLNQALKQQLPPRLLRDLRRRCWEAAGDWHEVPFHGQVAEAEVEVRGSQPKAGTTRFHTYATLALINKGRRVSLALTIVRKGERMVQIVQRLLDRARHLGVRLKLTYWDKAFGTIEVMRHLRARRVPYIIALAQRGQNGIKRLCGGRESYHTPYTFQSAAAGRYTTEVVIACKYSRKRYRKPGCRYFAYAVYRIGARSPLQVAAAYRRRFSIESGYRQVEQVRARTRTRNHTLRLLLFGIAILLVNLYVLLRRTCGILTSYGSRIRLIPLSLDQMVSDLRRYIQGVLGVNSVTQHRPCPVLS